MFNAVQHVSAPKKTDSFLRGTPSWYQWAISIKSKDIVENTVKGNHRGKPM